MKPKNQFKPQNLRSLLITLFAIVLAVSTLAFNWGLGQVRDYSIAVDQRLADADASSNQIQGLQSLKNQLAQSTELVGKANLLFASPATYQSQVLSDLQTYAAATGVSISRTEFKTSEANTPAVIVTLKTPVAYDKLIAFLTHVEGNLPKLQVSSITLGRADTPTPNLVHVGDIKIDISVR